MNPSTFLSVLFCILFVAPSFQYGILRVEEIWSNEDIPQVKIEDMIIEESQIYIDYIEDLSGNGVTVEDILFSDGSITIPGNFLTCCGVEFLSALHANGGIFADAGTGSNSFSFTVEDNTGDVFIASDLRAQGGIIASDRFFMDGITGDTTVEESLVRGNGGLFVNTDELVFSPDGDFSTNGNVQVADDVFFGEFSSNSERTITRFPASGRNGGSTYLVGQDAAESGGDLILEPGDGASIGDIFLATERNSDLFFGRTALSTNDNGGQFSILGQNSFSGDGGDLLFVGGNSAAVGTGGDMLILPGFSTLDGRPGKLILGSPDALEAGHDLLAGRVTIPSGNGGTTTYEGQRTENGKGGNLYFQAGDVDTGIGNPGDLILTPGVSSGTQTVVFGKNTATRLNFRRVQTVPSGGSTFFYGQNSTSGLGGDLYFHGGSSPSNFGSAEGGNLYLVPGSSVTGESGNIVLGLPGDALIFARPDSTVPGSTTISGQEGLDGVGGDLFLVGGEGVSHGGDVVIEGGDGALSVGGSVTIAGGDGSDQGGEVYFIAGHGGQRNGGEIAIATTNSPVLLSTSGQFQSGRIIAGPAAARFYVDQVPVVINEADIVITAGSDTVRISTNPNAIISWNGTPVLKETQPIPAVIQTTPVNGNTIRQDVSDLAIDFNNILQALNQCGHGLVTSITEPNMVTQRCP